MSANGRIFYSVLRRARPDGRMRGDGETETGDDASFICHSPSRNRCGGSPPADTDDRAPSITFACARATQRYAAPGDVTTHAIENKRSGMEEKPDRVSEWKSARRRRHTSL